MTQNYLNYVNRLTVAIARCKRQTRQSHFDIKPLIVSVVFEFASGLTFTYCMYNAGTNSQYLQLLNCTRGKARRGLRGAQSIKSLGRSYWSWAAIRATTHAHSLSLPLSPW